MRGELCGRVESACRGAVSALGERARAHWAAHYGWGACAGDLLAGVTVALTLVPQAMAYAALAGLQPQYGLYSSLAGGLVYACAGSVPQVSVGPSALLALLTHAYAAPPPAPAAPAALQQQARAQLAAALCLWAGLAQLAAGASRLGLLVDLVSAPVVSGFTSAAALTIASSQLRPLLGLTVRGPATEGFLPSCKLIVQHVGDARLPDALMSLACCLFLFSIKALKDIKIAGKDENKKKVLSGVLWTLGVGRNATAVVMAALAGYLAHSHGRELFLLTGPIAAGLPELRVPTLDVRAGNMTLGVWDTAAHLGSGLLVVPLLAIIANIAIAKAFGGGRRVAATQEILALGLCNVAGACLGSFPTSGSFTRSAVADASGVRTPAASLVTAAVVAVALALLTPYFAFIPRAALAAVIVCAVLHMVDARILLTLYRTSRFDLIPLCTTFVVCLALGMEAGLAAGVAMDALLLLLYHARPSLAVTLLQEPAPHWLVQLPPALTFAGVRRLRELAALDDGAPTPAAAPAPARALVLQCARLHRLDYTALQCLASVVDAHAACGRRVLACGAGDSLHVCEHTRPSRGLEPSEERFVCEELQRTLCSCAGGGSGGDGTPAPVVASVSDHPNSGTCHSYTGSGMQPHSSDTRL